MTHGCLIIRFTEEAAKEEGGRHEFILHTHHTGQDIPDTIKKSILALAKYYGMFNPKTKEEAARVIQSNVMDERLQYPWSVAGLIIATQVCYLEPISKEILNYLPKWGGQREPYLLEIDDQKWTLYDESPDNWSAGGPSVLYVLDTFDCLAIALMSNMKFKKKSR